MRPDKHGKQKQIWYYRLSDDPKRQMRSTGVIGKRNRWQADAWVRKLIEEKNRRPDSPTLREYAEPFFIEGTCPHVARLQQENKSIGASHIKKSRKMLENHIFKDPIADKPIAEIKRGDLFDFRTRLIEEKLPGKRNTIDKIMTTLKTVFTEAWNRDDIPSNPAYRIGFVHKKGQRGAFTAAEVQKLFPADNLGPWSDQEIYTIFLLAATSGMRWGELRVLSWAQIDLEKNTILVNRAVKAESTVIDLPKWGKIRTTFLIPKAAAAIKALQKTRQVGLVFSDKQGRPHAYKWWGEAFKTAMDNAGFTEEIRAKRGLVPHSFRATANSVLLDLGANPAKIRAALGWTKEDTQTGYTDVSTFDLSEMAGKMQKAVE